MKGHFQYNNNYSHPLMNFAFSILSGNMVSHFNSWKLQEMNVFLRFP